MSHDLFKPVPITVPQVGGSKGKYSKDEHGLPTLQPGYATTGGLQRILNEFAFRIQTATIEQIKQRIPMGILILDGEEPTIEFRYMGRLKNKVGYSPEKLDVSNNPVAKFSIWGHRFGFASRSS